MKIALCLSSGVKHIADGEHASLVLNLGKHIAHMTRLRSALLAVSGAVAFSFFSMTAALAVSCHDWSAEVSLSGIVAEQIFPGPPNWESIEDGDASLTAIFLELDEPICLRNGDRELDQEDIDGLAAIHLVPGEFTAQLTAGARVQVSGTFMESHTGYHQTPALLMVGSVTGAPPEQFLATFEACEATEAFSDYADRLGAYFANPCCEPGPAMINDKISISPPQELAAAIGQPTVTNHGEYTEVILPISGDYGGVPVTELAFSFGNENGIFAARLQFGAPRAIVQDRFGAAIEAADAAGSAAWETEGYGYSAQIPDGELGAIVCDWSV